jgi:UDP-N-acetylglucosamine 2-epimerase (non-hydrolysing)
MIQVFACLGTRPEAVKLATVVAELQRRPSFKPTLLSTSQHASAIRPILEPFGLKPDIELPPAPGDGEGEAKQTSSRLSVLAAHVLDKADQIFARHRPDVVLVQGDTTSAFAVALAAFHRGIPVGHVEAGLRSDDRRAPFPEEVNRRFISQSADLHFAPTRRAEARLLREGVAEKSVFLVGNTVVDSLLQMADLLGLERRTGRSVRRGRRRILVTAHRRENWDNLRGIATAIHTVHEAAPDVEFTLPLHPNPAVRQKLGQALEGLARVKLTEPLGYAEFLTEMASSELVLSDSGGVQEEAPLFGTRVLVMRSRTERPECLDTGLVELVGSDPEHIANRTLALLEEVPAAAPPLESYPFGDGKASARIADVLEAHIGI